jgi:hypothetical protein
VPELRRLWTAMSGVSAGYHFQGRDAEGAAHGEETPV